MITELTRTQKWVLGLAIVPMLAVGVAGGIGTFSNISHAYGSGTAAGALAAGEGATAVLAMLLLGLTLLGQSAPPLIHVGLVALPAVAAVMGATAARDGLGQTVVYAATPMAITASAEGIAFLARRVVIHLTGRDADAEARAAATIRDLAYHQARAAAHPKDRVRERSVKKSWKLARKVGAGDTALGGQLMDVQRTRLVQGADVALERMFAPGVTSPAAAALTASAEAPRAILPASADDAAPPEVEGATVREDISGYPDEMPDDQGGDTESVRPDLKVVRAAKDKVPSIAADVRQMVKDGVCDVRYVVDAIATRHGRDAADPKLKATVSKAFRSAARAAEAQTAPTDDQAHGAYL